jgi:tryptophan-rich sensory protein
VEELGGKVIKPKTEVRSYGWFAVYMNTENNIFALWEANTKKNALRLACLFFGYLINLALNFIFGIVLAQSVKPTAKDA